MSSLSITFLSYVLVFPFVRVGVLVFLFVRVLGVSLSCVCCVFPFPVRVDFCTCDLIVSMFIDGFL